MKHRPLVSFLLTTYNHQSFIEKALRGALAQSYSPLEIVVSDDCSGDQTFPIIQKIVSSYRGPHKLIVNRNPSNLGIGEHVNVMMGLGNGELNVFSAGDDI